MITLSLLAILVTLTASLYFSVRAFRSHRLPFETKALMAVTWVIIIAGLAFVATRLAL